MISAIVKLKIAFWSSVFCVMVVPCPLYVGLNVKLNHFGIFSYLPLSFCFVSLCKTLFDPESKSLFLIDLWSAEDIGLLIGSTDHTVAGRKGCCLD